MPDQPAPDFTEYDKLLEKNGPVMIVGQQFLKIASLSSDDIVFPPSYANPSEKKDGAPVYNIDVLDPWNSAKNVCVLDSIPSQANRIEPLFEDDVYKSLVPQYTVKLTNHLAPVSILRAGHRITDAMFRGTMLRATIVEALQAYAKGDATKIAKIAPTSLVFGAWDSRGIGVKIPRLVSSIVRAFGVTQLKRSAQYSPPVKYEQEGLIPAGLEGKPADHGLADVPSTHTIGGVQVNGDIRRDFSLNLELLRELRGSTPEETLKLQRYILALALLAFTATQKSTLRQGCQLLPKDKAKWKAFRPDGTESDWNRDTLVFADFATTAAAAFGVVQPVNQPLVFDKSLLKTSIEEDAKKKADKKAENAGNPADNLRALVDKLDPDRNDKFSAAKTKPLAKLQEAIAAIEADSAADEDLKQLAANLNPLLIADSGAAARKGRMLALFSAALDKSAIPTEVSEESTEEAPQ